MDSPPLRYLLIENGRPTGPHDLVVLQQKAEVYAITRDTYAAPESDPAQWLPIRAFAPLHDALFREKPKFTLAAHPVEVVNTSALVAPPSVDEILQSNLARQEAAAGELLKPVQHFNNRRRDLTFLLILGACLGFVPCFFIPITFGLILLCLAFIAVYALCVVWMLYFVMSRY